MRDRLGTPDNVVSGLSEVGFWFWCNFFAPKTGTEIHTSPEETLLTLSPMPQPVDKPDNVASGPLPPPFKEDRRMNEKVQDPISREPTPPVLKGLIIENLLTASSEDLPPSMSTPSRPTFDDGSARRALGSARLNGHSAEAQYNSFLRDPVQESSRCRGN